tara:strand:- start:42 stop:314 length:273 start_codon:yes stop_codon:yes gene_type:complete
MLGVTATSTLCCGRTFHGKLVITLQRLFARELPGASTKEGKKLIYILLPLILAMDRMGSFVPSKPSTLSIRTLTVFLPLLHDRYSCCCKW